MKDLPSVEAEVEQKSVFSRVISLLGWGLNGFSLHNSCLYFYFALQKLLFEEAQRRRQNFFPIRITSYVIPIPLFFRPTENFSSPFTIIPIKHLKWVQKTQKTFLLLCPLSGKAGGVGEVGNKF